MLKFNLNQTKKLQVHQALIQMDRIAILNRKAKVLVQITIRIMMVIQVHRAVVTVGQVDLAVCIIIDLLLTIFPLDPNA